MGRLSLRAKLTLGATLLAALAVIGGLVVLLNTLRSSLTDQVDADLNRQVNDIAFGIDDLGRADIALVSGDFWNLTVIYDQDLNFVVSNVGADDLITETEILEVPAGEDGELADAYPEDFSGYTIALPASPFTKTRTLGLVPSFDGEYLVFVGQSLEPVDETVATVRRWSLFAGPLFVAFIAALVWALTGRTLHRVDAMRSQVDHITATADLSRRVAQPAGGDEISRLASTMNQMLDRLQANDLRQRRFMSDAAHELRSPLASMAAQIDVELAHPDQADWPATGVAVRKDASRLERIIDDLLGLARIEVGDAPVGRRADRFDLGDLVIEQAYIASSGSASSGSASSGSAASGSRSRDIELDLSGVASVEVTGARSQLERVVVNLVANAYRHAATQVSVTVSASPDDDRAVIEVTDDGQGIAPEDRQVIFDRFVRLDEARSRDAGGSGLGLALVREIVDGHDGTIEVGDAPTGGARFTVTLPRSNRATLAR